jgi:hypothetical protein
MNIFSALLIAGILIIFLNNRLTCPPNKVEYRYLPRTLSHQMEDAAFSTEDMIKTMTDDNGNVWLSYKHA